ncbi:MAG: cytochrome c [Bacteroidetes bacterium]|nr:cytochrome c [Bacteroidota bacterium]
MNTYLQNSLIIKSFFTLIFFLIIFPLYSQDGESIFKLNCAACHTIGKGTLIGPDLANVHLRRNRDWLFKIIRSSQTLINSGDETAVALFKQFNMVQMPDQTAFTDDDLNAILTYIEGESPEYIPETETTVAQADETPVEVEITGKPVDEATKEDILNGRLLFSGETRLENGGPACLTCHNVLNDNLIGGGLLAKDLTEAFTRLNENGIKAMVSNPPFPVMRTAYDNHPVNSDETYLITAFLKFADQERYYQHHRDYQARFLYTGIAGFIVLLIVFTVIWRKRKYASVNQKIFDRQLKSDSYY